MEKESKKVWAVSLLGLDRPSPLAGLGDVAAVPLLRSCYRSLIEWGEDAENIACDSVDGKWRLTIKADSEEHANLMAEELRNWRQLVGVREFKVEQEDASQFDRQHRTQDGLSKLLKAIDLQDELLGASETLDKDRVAKNRQRLIHRLTGTLALMLNVESDCY